MNRDHRAIIQIIKLQLQKLQITMNEIMVGGESNEEENSFIEIYNNIKWQINLHIYEWNPWNYKCLWAYHLIYYILSTKVV